jgi:alkyl hydroperoxide reductase subunit AhpC
MTLRIGDIAPDFEADTTEGRIRFRDWIGHSWAVLFSHPKEKPVRVYPMTTGRDFDAGLCVIDSLQLTAEHRVATPANWKQGEDVIIAGSVSDDEARNLYPQGWKSPRPYLRIVPQPR